MVVGLATGIQIDRTYPHRVAEHQSMRVGKNARHRNSPRGGQDRDGIVRRDRRRGCVGAKFIRTQPNHRSIALTL